MRIVNILSQNINIGGGIYCISDITFPYGKFDKELCMDDNTISYDIDIKGDLFITGNMYLYEHPLVITNDELWNDYLRKDYNKTDFRVIKADHVNFVYKSIRVGKDITAYYDFIDEIRLLKLKEIKNRLCT